MNKATTKWRTKANRSAIASVRAEGVAPSKKTVTQMRAYAAGKISASQLRESVRLNPNHQSPRG